MYREICHAMEMEPDAPMGSQKPDKLTFQYQGIEAVLDNVVIDATNA